MRRGGRGNDRGLEQLQPVKCFPGALPVSLGVMLSDLGILSITRSLQNHFFHRLGLGEAEMADILKPPLTSSVGQGEGLIAFFFLSPF